MRSVCLVLSLLCMLRQTSATPSCVGSANDTQLCSSPQNLTQDALVCPRIALTFTCTTIRSNSLVWTSDHYIGDMGADIFFTFREMVGSNVTSPNRVSFANLTNVNASDRTMVMLESQLHIVVSDQYNSSQIVCTNTGSGTSVPINFNVDLDKTSIECQNDLSTATQMIISTSEPSSQSLTTIILKIVVPIIIGALIGAIIIIILCCCCCVPRCPCHHRKVCL